MISKGQTALHHRALGGCNAAQIAPCCPALLCLRRGGQQQGPKHPGSPQSWGMGRARLKSLCSGKHPTALPRARLGAFLPCATVPRCSYPSWALPMHPMLPLHRRLPWEGSLGTRCFAAGASECPAQILCSLLQGVTVGEGRRESVGALLGSGS